MAPLLEADRKCAALQEWRALGRELIAAAQRSFAAVRTIHPKAHSWGGDGRVRFGEFVTTDKGVLVYTESSVYSPPRVEKDDGAGA